LGNSGGLRKEEEDDERRERERESEEEDVRRRIVEEGKECGCNEEKLTTCKPFIVGYGDSWVQISTIVTANDQTSLFGLYRE
jgi:hypothetical protein